MTHKPVCKYLGIGNFGNPAIERNNNNYFCLSEIKNDKKKFIEIYQFFFQKIEVFFGYFSLNRLPKDNINFSTM